MKLESQDDIAYLTGKRSPEEQKKQIKMPKHSLRCSSCGRFVPAGAVRCQSCGAEL
jgi:rRNA maturation endonuclease Nob1